jgi:hypothetical protein
MAKLRKHDGEVENLQRTWRSNYNATPVASASASTPVSGTRRSARGTGAEPETMKETEVNSSKGYDFAHPRQDHCADQRDLHQDCVSSGCSKCSLVFVRLLLLLNLVLYVAYGLGL